MQSINLLLYVSKYAKYPLSSFQNYPRCSRVYYFRKWYYLWYEPVFLWKICCLNGGRLVGWAELRFHASWSRYIRRLLSLITIPLQVPQNNNHRAVQVLDHSHLSPKTSAIFEAAPEYVITYTSVSCFWSQGTPAIWHHHQAYGPLHHSFIATVPPRQRSKFTPNSSRYVLRRCCHR